MNENYLDVRTLVIDNSINGRITLDTIKGIISLDLKKFISQDADAILYDLNRDYATLLSTKNNNPRWINDYASALVIKELKSIISKYELKYGTLKD